MKFSELYRLLERNGWKEKPGKQKGKKHSKYVHPSYPSAFILVGRHPSQEVPTGTLDEILKKAGLK